MCLSECGNVISTFPTREWWFWHIKGKQLEFQHIYYEDKSWSRWCSWSGEKINSQFCSVGKDLTVIAYDNLLLHECLCVLWWCTAIPHAVRIDVHVSYVSTNNGWFGSRAPAVQEMIASWKPTRSSVQNWMVITPHSQIKERLNPLR